MTLDRELRQRLNTDNMLRSLALAAWLLVCISIVLGLAIWMARGSPRLPVSYVGGAMGTSSVVLCGLAFSTAAAFLTARAPRNLIGWVFMAIGLGMAVVLPINIALADVVRQFRLIDTPVIWVAWAVTSVQVPVSGTALVIVLLLFPTGRPEWRHWRAAMALAVAGGVLVSGGAALRPDGLLWYPTLPNPLDVPLEMRDVLDASVALGTVLLTVALASAGIWLTRRAWRADGAQRRQLAWVVAGGLIMSVTLVPLFVTRYVASVDDALGERVVFVAAVGAIALPITVAIAVQREGLFGVRDLLGRSLVYLPLMALLAGLYTASVIDLPEGLRRDHRHRFRCRRGPRHAPRGHVAHARQEPARDHRQASDRSPTRGCDERGVGGFTGSRPCCRPRGAPRTARSPARRARGAEPGRTDRSTHERCQRPEAKRTAARRFRPASGPRLAAQTRAGTKRGSTA